MEPNFKKLILVRHGAYNRKDVLSIRGTEQTNSLIDQIKKEIGDNKRIKIITSTAIFAIQSAEIIAESLSIKPQESQLLFVDNNISADMSSLYNWLELEEELDVIILITHNDYLKEFPSYFGHKKLETRLFCHQVRNGAGWSIDLEKKTIKHLTNKTIRS